MWHLPRPDQKARDTYLTCISRISDLPLQNRMSRLAEDVADAEELYVLSAQQEKLYDLESSTSTPSDEIVRKELIKTYTESWAPLDGRSTTN